MGAKPNEQILVADTPEQYARHIIDLLQNEAKAKQIAMNGYQFVVGGFNWQSTTAILEKLISRK